MEKEILAYCDICGDIAEYESTAQDLCSPCYEHEKINQVMNRKEIKNE